VNVPTLMTKIAALRGHPIPVSTQSVPLDPHGSEVIRADARGQVKRAKGVRRVANIEYVRHVGASAKGAPLGLRLDLLIPKAQGAHPLVVYVPGGGFVVSPKIAAARMRRYVASAGYVVASVEYRTTRHGATYVEGVTDIRSAISYLRAHAEEYAIDIDRIAVWGESAGGYLAAMVGLTNDEDRLNPDGTKISAVIDKFGASSLDRLAEGFDREAMAATYAPGSAIARYIHGPQARLVSDNQARVKAADPITYVSSTAPPFLLFHGSDDRLVSPVQTALLHAALRSCGADSTRYLVEGAGHGDIAMRSGEEKFWTTATMMDILVNFLRRTLGES
jgi:acetyl esterase/lipase